MNQATTPHTIHVLRTHLEMHARPAVTAITDVTGSRIERVLNCPHSFYRYLYREVGRAYHWVDRLSEPDEAVRATIEASGHELWLLTFEGAPAGYYELKRQPDRTVGLAYFGLLPEYHGRGLGKQLLQHAIARAWEGDTRRLDVNTCTLDGPAALPNYLKAGFQVAREDSYSTAWVPDLCEHCRALAPAAR